MAKEEFEVIIHTMKEDLLHLQRGEGEEKITPTVITETRTPEKDVQRLIQEALQEKRKVAEERRRGEKEGTEAERKDREEAVRKTQEETRKETLLAAQQKAVEITAQKEAARKAQEKAEKEAREKQAKRALAKAQAQLAEEKKKKETLERALERKKEIAQRKALLAQVQIKAERIIAEEIARQKKKEELQHRQWKRSLETAQKRAKEILDLEEKAVEEKLVKGKLALEKKIRSLTEKIAQIPIQKRPILNQKQKLEEIKAQLVRVNEKIRERLEKTQEKRKQIEAQEAAAQTPKEKRKFEKQRWQLTARQREIERELWQNEEEISKNLLVLNKEKQQEEDLEEEKAVLLSEKKMIEWRQEKIGIQKRLEEIGQSKEDPSHQLRRSRVGKEQLEKKLSEIIAQEELIEEKERKFEAVPAEKKALVEQRWQAEKERKAIEEKRWETEEAIEAARATISRILPVYKSLIEEEKQLLERDHEVNVFLKYGLEEGEKKLKEEKEKPPVEKKEEKEEPPAKKPKTAEEIKRGKLIQEVKENIRIIKKESQKLGDSAKRQNYLKKTKGELVESYPELNPQSIEVYWQEIK